MNEQTRQEAPSSGVPVVGVGASAGGLAALKALLVAAGDRLGAAVVVVQHLDPTHPSMMSSLLARHARLRVIEAEHGVQLARDTVYTTPPGKSVKLQGDRLVLETPREARYQRTPVDIFFRSLAEGRGEGAICVVLSGTGSDGVQGVRDVKGAGGAAIVQSPEDAEFDGMPRAAIATDLVDIVLPAEEIPTRLREVLRRGAALAAEGPDLAGEAPEAFERIMRLIESRTGYDFGGYKRATMNRRIARRMALTHERSLDAYAERLERDGDEAGLLTKDLLIGVTRFFRDSENWEAVASEAIQPALSRLGDGGQYRIWVAGCATGEEAYTLAMIALDRVEATGRSIRLQVFATDVNPDALAQARVGRYAASAARDIPERYTRFVSVEEDGVVVTKRLRECVVIAAQNAIADPPFSQLDLVSCRNLMIYLDTPAQDRLLETFHFALKEGGLLLLGLSESADRAPGRFEPVSKRHRLYRRKPGSARPPMLAAKPYGGGMAGREAPAREDDGDDKARYGATPRLAMDGVVRTMLTRFAPPSVLVDEKFDVVAFHGDVSPFLSFRSGAMTGGLVSMVDDALQGRLWNTLKTARAGGEACEARIADAPRPDGRGVLRLLVEPYAPGGAQSHHFLVYFLADAVSGALPQASSRRPGAPSESERDDLLAHYQAELEATRRELQETIERAETSNEELQAANEEVMSANEELQSSNEELETSREELQSLNEELSTVNAELEEKVAELEAANDDLANLVSSTDVATIFLDERFHIRRFSMRARDILDLVDADIGRPLSAFALKVEDPGLLDDARRVLSTLKSAETEVRGVADGHDPSPAYLRRVVPYRTREDRIQGVVVTFAEVTSLRVTAERLEAERRRQSAIAELGELALGTEDLEALAIRAACNAAERLGTPMVAVERLSSDHRRLRLVAGTGWARGLVGYAETPAGIGEPSGFALRRSGPVLVEDLAAETRFGASRLLADHDAVTGAVVAIGPPGNAWGVLGAWRAEGRALDEDDARFLQSLANILWLAISAKRVRGAREAERGALRRLMDGLPMMIAVLDTECRFELANRAFETLGWSPEELEGADVGEALGASERERLHQAFYDALAGAQASLEVTLTPPGEEARTYLVHLAPRGTDGGVDGVFLAALDITERKRVESRNTVISAELDHRVKNILALVNTIARMTGRKATSVEGFKRDFEARIASLARTHTALAENAWDAIALDALLKRELAAYAEVDGERVTLDGPSIALDMRASQSLALAFHELTTNAVKHGALAGTTGRLTIVWRVEADRFCLCWRESGLVGVTPPERRGFGTRILESVVAEQLRGETRLEFGEDGVFWRLDCAAETLDVKERR